MEKKSDKRQNRVGKYIPTNKDGSAILIAIIVMMVTLMLSLALLLTSYSLFATVSRQKNMEQCKEMAQSVSREIEREITGAETNFDSFDSMKKAAEEQASPLWFYLRFHLWQTSWPYYNEEERGHSKNYALREFLLNTDDIQKETEILDNVSVKMYWESEDGAQKSGGTSLFIKVSCAIGKQEAVITSVYDLSVEENVPGYTKEETEIIVSPYNSENNAVAKNEKWIFSLSERY